jgi:bisphosphoglycerate-dependent phosphoglycerate mutase
MDPRIDVNMADLEARYQLVDRLMANVEVATEAADRLRAAQKTIGQVNDQLDALPDSTAQNLREQGSAMQDSIETLMADIRGQEDVQGIRRDPSVVTAKIFTASRYLQSSTDAPSQSERRALQHAEARLQRLIDNVNAFFEDDWPAYRSAVEQADLQLFSDYEPLRLTE